MVLGAQGAQEDQTEGGSPGSPDGESPGIQKDVDSTTGNYGLRQSALKNSFYQKLSLSNSYNPKGGIAGSFVPKMLASPTKGGSDLCYNFFDGFVHNALKGPQR